MSSLQDEGSGCSATTEAQRTEGLDKNSEQVELYGGGWSGMIGHCPQFKLTTPVTDATGLVVFERIEASSLVFRHAIAVLIMQGMTLQNLFPPDVGFKIKGEKTMLVQGPFIFLRGELSTPIDPPLRLKNVLLAHVLQVPETVSREELLAVLLQANRLA